MKDIMNIKKVGDVPVIKGKQIKIEIPREIEKNIHEEIRDIAEKYKDWVIFALPRDMTIEEAVVKLQ